MKTRQLALLGVVTLSLAIQGCSSGFLHSQSVELQPNQDEIVYVVGQTRELEVFNQKKPITISFKSGDSRILQVNGQDFMEFKQTVNPQDVIKMNISLKEQGSSKLDNYEVKVVSYKEAQYHHNRQNIVEKNFIKSKYGNSFSVAGHSYQYDAQHKAEMTLDMHEHNQLQKQEFNLHNTNPQTLVKIIAPKDASFILENGAVKQEYQFNLDKGKVSQVSMKIRENATGKIESKNYVFRTQS